MKLRSIEGVHCVPDFMGVATFGDGTWGAVMELVEVPVSKCWRGTSNSVFLPIALTDCKRSPSKSGQLLGHLLKGLEYGLPQIHRAGVYHGDIKPANMGFKVDPSASVPVQTYSHLHLRVFDFGCSWYMQWDSGTKPYGAKVWFKKYPGVSGRSTLEQCQATDYFQSLMTVVVLMVGGVLPVLAIGHTQELGASWVSNLQSRAPVGWVQWLLSHECSCDETVRTTLCQPLKQYACVYEEIKQYDHLFSSKFLGNNTIRFV
jgi:serine/threonine protein kinase